MCLVVLFLSVYLTLILWHRAAAYSLSAVTEAASIVVDDRAGVSVWLPNASVSNPQNSEKRIQIPDRVLLNVDDGVKIRLARERKGDLLLQLNWAPGSGRGAALDGRLASSGDQSVNLSSGDVIRVKLGGDSDAGASGFGPQTVLLSFRGDLKVGNDVGPQVERTLLSGTVTVVESGFLHGGRYAIATAALDPGDEVFWRLRRSNGKVIPVVSGFVHVGSDDAMEVVGHAAADYVEIARFGAASYEIKPELVQRIIHDPVISAVTATVTCLGLLSAMLGAFEWILKGRGKR